MTGARFIHDEQERLVAWAQERLKPYRFRDDVQAIGHEIGGELAAVVAFDTHSPNGCMVSLASDTSGRWASWRWSSERFAIVSMAYPFLQCGYTRISCVISANNRRSLRYTRHFGWKEEGVLREAGADGEDMILFGMLRKECRWLPPAMATAGLIGAGAL